ncbi:hypothetical protein ACPUD8_12910 [Brevibacterium sp. FAM 25378]|uniref:hypothetical protein n=1 Tax=unclassified Brevibacterium TaxID=2614124 RepID=UPI0010923B00|nr:hypothetical protein [Brevibacterium sp. S22]
MSASYEETMTIPVAAADVWQRAIQVLNSQQGVSGVMTHPGVLTASVNTNWRSWGEKLSVHVDEAPGCTFVRIRSVCAFPLQIIDWGKNKDNVLKVRAGLDPSRRP